MRTPLLVLALLVSLAPTPALAQDATPTPFLEDPAGDVKATLDGTQVPAPSGFTALDLRSLTIAEDPAAFHFDLHLEDLGDDGPRPDWGTTQLRFGFDGARFLINFHRSEDNAAYFGGLYRQGSEGESHVYVRGLPVERDLATGHLWTSVERMEITGGDGGMPGRGDVLSDVRVAASAAAGYLVQPQNFLGVGPWIPTHVGDIMPDGDLPSWTVLFGGGDSQGVTLDAPQPFRASNGEATTYLYRVTATHGGDAEARYRVWIEDIPLGWNVSLPGELIDLPAGQPLEFPVYVTTTFRHDHGTAEAFRVHLHEEGGERWGTVELGVNFLAVAQPAGHHPKLWLHSSYLGNAVGEVNHALGGTNGYVSMNTLQEDAADTGVAIAGMSQVGGVGTTSFRWSVCLEPALRLGLDFDLAGIGALEVPISTTKPLPAATLTGRLLHLGPGEPLASCYPSQYADREQTVLAELTGTAQDIAAQGTATLAASLVPQAEADYVPAADGAGLVLELTLTAVGVDSWGTGGPMLEPGGSLLLPLNEYHDALQVSAPMAGESAPGFVATKQPGKDAPGLALPLVVGLLALLALARRR